MKVDCKKVDFNLYSKIFHFVITGGNAIVAPILCHREPSQMAWRSRFVICRASRGHYLLDCFVTLAMTRVCYVRNDKGGTCAAHNKGGGVAGALWVTCIAR